MDFIFTQEQDMLANSLRRLIHAQWNTEHRRRARTESSIEASHWDALTDIGVLGLTIPDTHDGFGEDPATLLPVHYELGRGLVSEPVIPSAVMSASLLLSTPSCHEYLSGIASGEHIFTIADQSPSDHPCQLKATPEGYTLTGTVFNVWYGAQATHWIISAKLPSEQIALILIPRDADHVEVHDAPTFDYARCATLTFTHTTIKSKQIIACGDEAQTAYLNSQHWGIAALCAHASGAMDRLIEMTTHYLTIRQQFGTALAQFQVLQHALADMQIAKEMALSMAYVAVSALTDTNPRRRQEKISSAKIEVGRAGRFIGQKAVQLHGGMGITDELEVGDFFKRLTAIELMLGDTNYHLATIASQELDDDNSFI